MNFFSSTWLAVTCYSYSVSCDAISRQIFHPPPYETWSGDLRSPIFTALTPDGTKSDRQNYPTSPDRYLSGDISG